MKIVLFLLLGLFFQLRPCTVQLLDPNAVQAISFPPHRAAFFNNSAVPSHWHVICAWPEGSSCDYLDADYDPARDMPCYVHGAHVDIPDAFVSCTMQRDARGMHWVVQNSCSVVVVSVTRPWTPRLIGTEMMRRYHAQMDAQIVASRSVFRHAVCRASDLSFYRSMFQNVIDLICGIYQFLALFLKRCGVITEHVPWHFHVWSVVYIKYVCFGAVGSFCVKYPSLAIHLLYASAIYLICVLQFVTYDPATHRLLHTMESFLKG